MSSSRFRMLQVAMVLLSVDVARNNVISDNVYCGPYVDYIRTDPENFVLLPFVVKLHRCHGSVGLIPPNVRQCVPQNVTKIVVYTQNIQTHRFENKILLNHTSCTGECSSNPSSCNKHETWNAKECECGCNYSHNKPPKKDMCCSPKVWSQAYCNCVCSTSPQRCANKMKKWSNDNCGCKCRPTYFHLCSQQNTTMDPNTCLCTLKTSAQSGCVMKGVISIDVAVLVMIAEALLLAFCFVVYRIICHKIQGDAAEKSNLIPDTTGNRKISLQLNNSNNVM